MRVASVGILVMLALFIAACGGGSNSSSASSTSGIEMKVEVVKQGNIKNYKPEVTLECVGRPCGSNQSQEKWHGYFRVRKSNLPPNTEVVIVVTMPNHKPYPYDQYTPYGEKYGKRGNVQYTDSSGLLPKFKWAALNEFAPVDPPGKYHLTFYVKAYGKVVHTRVPMTLAHLP